MIQTKPKIGIRPTIDARPGVRDSLEVQTMNIAKKVAELLSSKLKYPDGTPIECILADSTIGRVAEAARCEEKFIREGVGVSITVTPCWCYGTETIDMNPARPKAIFGFNGTERPGAVFLAAAISGHNQKGIPAFSIYGHDVQDSDDASIPEDVAAKLVRFAKAGMAVALMKDQSYLSVGGVSMGIAGSVVDNDFFSSFLGMRNEFVDMCEVSRRIEGKIFDPDEYSRALAWTKKNCSEGRDVNENPSSREKKDQDWEFVVKMAIIMKDLMVGNPKLKALGFAEEALGHNAILSGFQGQRQWTDCLPNGDFMEAILNSSFDWNGRRSPFLVATENDSLNGVSMLMGYLLTNTAQIFCDVRTYWSPDSVKRVTGKELTGLAKDGIIHMINSGAAALDGTGEQTENGAPAIKPFWDVSDKEVEQCLEATTWGAADQGYFRGGGYSSTFKSKGGMPMTMVRMNIVKGLGPVLQIAEGYSVEISDEIHDVLNERTSPTWPTTWFAPRIDGADGAFKDVYSVMANWGANHCSLSYGHIGADLITLASLLRIPVSMHNIPAEHVFRPASWSAFGTKELEGADFRACKAYGSLYGF